MNDESSDKDKEELNLLKLQKEVWEKAVDTQMHFNEMSVKSRQLGLSFVVAALALAFILLSRRQDFWVSFWNVEIHISGILVLISAMGLFAVKRLDLGVYHQMLRGAVRFGGQLEKEVLREKLMKTPKGMTEFITLYSQNSDIDPNTFKGTSKNRLISPRFYVVAAF
ncbi:MAG: hypothetical protein O2807_00530 [bacterium]|nr:hypothetical protein [bacterium]